MKSILIRAVLILIASARLQATEALMFYGGDYTLYILIGQAEKSNVAQVKVMVPGAKDWLFVPREQLQIKKFDDHKQVLRMRFSNPKNDPELPPSFTFSAKEDKAVLTIKGKTIKSSFNWLDQ
jgi:hypothetical protein